MHLLRRDRPALPEALTAAYRDSDSLVMELDVDDVDEIEELKPEDRDELIRERAEHSHGLAHAVARFLEDHGVDLEGRDVKDALADFLESEGVDLTPDEDGDVNLRKRFISYLEENGVDVENGKLREDGRVERDMYLFQVKSPAESKSKDDIYKLLATVPGNEAYRPIKDGKCPFIKG